MKKLEKLPRLVREGKVSPDKAALQIMETVYKNKSWFGLKKLQEDQLHDFMLFYYERSKLVFTLYEESLGSFASFLYGNINNAVMAWSRSSQRQIYEEQSMQTLQKLIYEESAATYETMEPPEVCEISVQEIPSMKKVLELTKKVKGDYKIKRGRRLKTISNLEKRKNESIRKEACLVLLLKSCSFVNEMIMEKVASVCEKSYDEIKKLVELARESIKSKKDRITRLQNARDNFFYYKRKYMAVLESMDSNTDFCEIISNKILKADRAWKSKTEKLQSESLRVPSNVTIGKILGLSDRRVRYVIDLTTKNMDNISLKSYYGDYEDILSKRKSKQKKGNV